MNNIKHISLDVWNTLLIPNKEFSKRRTEFLASYFDMPVELAKIEFTATKHILDTMAMERGVSLPPFNVYVLLFNRFNSDKFDEIPTVRNKILELFKQYPPEMIKETRDELSRIYIDGKYSLGIISNTNFVSGDVLHDTLVEQSGVKFESPVFSDLVGFAKPSKGIFNIHFQGLRRFKPELKKENVVHIGDSAVCDFSGAGGFGFEKIWCNSAHHVPSILQDFK
jgi:putative hydrolase of the HAD superfamily